MLLIFDIFDPPTPFPLLADFIYGQPHMKTSCQYNSKFILTNEMLYNISPDLGLYCQGEMCSIFQMNDVFALLSIS